MKKLLFFFLFIVFYFSLTAQDFEGKIFFTKQSTQDTTFYTYLIKGNNMRIDETDNNKTIIQSLLINFENKTMTALSPMRKMYMPFPISSIHASSPSDFIIKQTNKTKKISGYTCKYWTIENKSENTFIEYWVANDSFAFFEKFLNLSNVADKSAMYFLQFPKLQGMFPMLSIEKTLTGEKNLTLKVLSIEKTALSKDMFSIPSDYISFGQ